MKISKYFFIILLTSTFCIQSNAQDEDLKLIALKSLDQYKSKEGKHLGTISSVKYFDFFWNTFSWVVNDDSKVIKSKPYWGFTIGGYLFRLQKGTAVMVVNEGDLIYYEHGVYHVWELIDGNGRFFEREEFRFYSSDLESKIYAHRYLKKLKKEDSKNQELIERLMKIRGSSQKERIQKTRQFISENN